jgi:hypothetical protein
MTSARSGGRTRSRPVAPAVQARIAEPGHFGKVMTPVEAAHPKTADYLLARGLAILTAAVPAVPRRRRRWALPRLRQIDQGNTPWCCPTTGKHWERSQPVTQESGDTNGDLYTLCKARDGYPAEEGTDGHALLEVYRQLGMIGNYFWAFDDSPATRERVHTWLAEVGPMWWGAYWAYEMCQTDSAGVFGPGAGRLELGHEVLVIGTDRDMFGRDQGGKEIVQSWGLGNFGVLHPAVHSPPADGRGRGFIRDDDFFRVLAANGDLAGVIQTVRPV